MGIALWVLGAIAYLNIGYRWGRWSWKVWNKKKRSAAAFLCFPLNYEYNRIGECGNSINESFIAPPVAESKTAEDHAQTIAFVWPLKLLFNAIATICIGGKFIGKLLSNAGSYCLDGFWFVAKNALKIVTNPISLLPKRPQQELAEEPLKQLPKPTLDAQPNNSNQFDIHEYQNLLIQKDKIEARLKELDAHMDKDKIIAFPKRL